MLVLVVADCADTPMVHTAAALLLQLQSKGRNASSLVEDQEMAKIDPFKDFKLIQKGSCIQTPWFQYLLKSFHRYPTAQLQPSSRWCGGSSPVLSIDCNF